MHELSLAQSILWAALDEARKVGGRRISLIRARVRESSHHTEDSSLQFCLEAVAKGTIAEGAEIEIEHIPPTLRCRGCDFIFPAQGGGMVCPRCRSGRLEEVDAEEVYLEDLQVE